MEKKIVYFESPGKKNTDETLSLARQRAGELDIRTVVVASTSGSTGAKAVGVFEGLRVVVVTHSFGSRESNSLELTDENLKAVQDKNGIILTATHAFGGIARSLQTRRRMSPGNDPQQGVMPSGGMPPARGDNVGEIAAGALGLFGRGMKVACEIALMAADAGLVRTDEEIISIGGTHAGADTAVVMLPANADRFFEMVIKEIICKPRL